MIISIIALLASILLPFIDKLSSKKDVKTEQTEKVITIRDTVYLEKQNMHRTSDTVVNINHNYNYKDQK